MLSFLWFRAVKTCELIYPFMADVDSSSFGRDRCLPGGFQRINVLQHDRLGFYNACGHAYVFFFVTPLLQRGVSQEKDLRMIFNMLDTENTGGKTYLHF